MFSYFQHSEEEKIEFLRTVLHLLVKKYHVKLSGVARDAEIYSTALNDFYNGRRKLNQESINRLEYLLEDLYGDLLIQEFPVLLGRKVN